AALLDAGCREDFLKALQVDLPGKPAHHLLEARHAIRHSGAGPTLSPIDSLKNVGHAREARHLLDAEHGGNLHLGLATAGQQSSHRRVLEPELETLGETVFPRRPNERLAVSQREPLSLGTA